MNMGSYGMRRDSWRLAIALLAAAIFAAGARADLPKHDGIRSIDRMENRAEDPPMTVGQIMVVGNETIPQGRIVDVLALYPGAKARLADLRAAERRLARLGLFEVDWKKGIYSKVSPVNFK
jgi:outer membrane protein assembly factor BamA